MPDARMAATDPAELARRDEWVAAVGRLIEEAEEWSRKRSWRAERQMRLIEDDPVGPYEMPQVWINPGRGRTVFLDPTSRFLPGGKGIVDLYLWPEFDGVMIPWTDGGWHVHLPTGRFDVDRLPWSETAFERAVNHLVGR